jgi:hypothetical protein
METSKDYIIALLQEKYEYELKRKDSFETALNVPISLLSVLFAGAYFVISDEKLSSGYCSLNTIKYIFLSLLFSSCVLTLIQLIRVYFGYNRSYCSFPESSIVFNQDYKALEAYHNENSKKSKVETELLDSLKDNVIKWYLDCNNHNTPVNDKRGNAYYLSRLFLCISLCIGLALLTLVCIIKLS